MKNMNATASAPAKVILFGEHFVVYGTPALLAALNRRTTARARAIEQETIAIRSDIGVSADFAHGGVRIRQGGEAAKTVLEAIHNAVQRGLGAGCKGIQLDLKSSIPAGVGLGSSAAACVAAVAAVDSLYGRHGRRWICKSAVESERIIHGNSSGADCYVSTYGGILRYSKGRYSRVETPKKLPLVVSSTGIAHSTAALVKGVRRFREADPGRFSEFAAEARTICDSATKHLRAGNVKQLGPLMLRNHELLREIGVSHEKSEELVELALQAGALGAKITGAGGGGAVISLAASRADASEIARKVRRKGYLSIEAEIDSEGLRRQPALRRFSEEMSGAPA